MRRGLMKINVFNQISISAKIVVGVLAFGVVAIIATTLLISSAVKSALHDQFESAHSDITALVAANAAGALRWKKTAAVAKAIKGVAGGGEPKTHGIIAIDADGALVASQESPVLSAEVLMTAAKPNLPLEAGETIALPATGNTLTVISAAGRDKKTGKPYGYLAIAWRTDALQSIVAQEQRSIVMMLGLAFVALAAGIVFLLRGLVNKPLAGIAERIAALTAGDISSEVPFGERQDEIGKIATAVVELTESEKRRIDLEENQRREAGVQVQRQEHIAEMTRSFQGAVSGLMQTVEGQMRKMRETADGLSRVASSTTQQIDIVSNSSDQASNNIQTVSSAAEELSASIREIGEQINRTTQVVSGADEQARQSAQKMNHLAGSSDKIGAVVDLIRDIADQTNLLALNATIEAARAGESGKGFAVVASEVKTLASQTAKATDEIASQVSEIQSATKEVEGEISQIVQTMSDVSELATAIAAAIEEQSAATEEISRNTVEAARGAEEVVQAMGQVSTSAADAETASTDVGVVSDDVDRMVSELRDAFDTYSKDIAAA